ncbi:MAG: bifunctional precorrin-2 dehydrogenase/sirohydrochlorin ferrochelatase [Prevotellaceae bacterium]|jgi:siroheme synthase-like protein|nr:bifunctional precorrin-2 dehydrogenase/sirohydrochlorin ferrochelatase [Prevotellaceae bacterium]
MERLQFLPICINITRKNILLVGGGRVAFHKASVLSRFTENVRVVAPEFHTGFELLPFERVQKVYEPDDLAGFFLVYICTGSERLNREIKEECARQGILASVCDNPALCDFTSPAVHKEGNVTIAVSSNAQSARQSIDIRNRIGELVKTEVIKLQ